MRVPAPGKLLWERSLAKPVCSHPIPSCPVPISYPVPIPFPYPILFHSHIPPRPIPISHSIPSHSHIPSHPHPILFPYLTPSHPTPISHPTPPHPQATTPPHTPPTPCTPARLPSPHPTSENPGFLPNHPKTLQQRPLNRRAPAHLRPPPARGTRFPQPRLTPFGAKHHPPGARPYSWARGRAPGPPNAARPFPRPAAGPGRGKAPALRRPGGAVARAASGPRWPRGLGGAGAGGMTPCSTRWPYTGPGVPQVTPWNRSDRVQALPGTTNDQIGACGLR